MAKKNKAKPDEAMLQLLKQSGNSDERIAFAAKRELAKAIEAVLREVVLRGDVIDGIFDPVDFQPGAPIEFPIDFLTPGTEKDFTAYTIPNHGRIPERHIEGDLVTVQTYEVGSSIDWNIKFSRDARWDVVGRGMEVFETGFTLKMNLDAWKTLLMAGLDRNILVYDAAAAAGTFTKRLVSLMKATMRRRGGGNTGSRNRGRLTDIYMSPEGLEDMREWGIDDIDEITRREIYLMQDGTIARVFNVNLHDLDELGENQEFQNYYLNVLGGTLGPSDTELVVGLDLQRSDSFVMPIREDVQVWDDPALHRQRREGFYGWGEVGFAVLDNRRVLLGSF